VTAPAAIDVDGRQSDQLGLCHEIVWIDRPRPLDTLTLAASRVDGGSDSAG
jgi:hypothetical protein